MQNKLSTEIYEGLTARQIEQYKETEIMHDLPPIYDYWSGQHMASKATSLFGYTGIVELYAQYFRKSLEESDSKYLVSIGAGDCSIEINIVKLLLALGQKDFSFNCLELSPIFVAKANQRIIEEGLTDFISVAQTDINTWKPEYKFAGVMAHHALHHMLELESLFSLIKSNLAKNGRFVTCDIIGRNGHMRWPEALVLIRKIWEKLPRRYKYNHQFKRLDEYFDNWDCSNEGFEGIRAEDILPLLVKTFSFETFFAYGNLTDPFTDRGFGPNFDKYNPTDTALIDYLHETNEYLIDAGILKPTCMIAVMTNEKRKTSFYKHWTPEFSIRDPKGTAPVYDLQPILEKIPVGVLNELKRETLSTVRNYQLNTILSFNNKAGAIGPRYLKYGWFPAEEDFTWSSCEDAGLFFPLEKPISRNAKLKLKFIPYIPSLKKIATIRVFVNDRHVKTINYSAPANLMELDVEIPAAIVSGQKIVSVTLMFPNRRQPQYEGGNDIRSMGIALFSASLIG